MNLKLHIFLALVSIFLVSTALQAQPFELQVKEESCVGNEAILLETEETQAMGEIALVGMGGMVAMAVQVIVMAAMVEDMPDEVFIT